MNRSRFTVYFIDGKKRQITHQGKDEHLFLDKLKGHFVNIKTIVIKSLPEKINPCDCHMCFLYGES